MTTAGALKESVCQSIEENRDRIIGVGEAIMDDPELGFKEHRTAEKVQEVFSDLGSPNDLQGAPLDFCLTAGEDLDLDGWTQLCGDGDDSDPATSPLADELCDGS